ncbi:MmcQ/YjbR family DNA-binding protein [Rubricoccus marinus]|uniref:MmcQ-like protein n=1 Tax=Rubricoccus marinus TaxID=716817 RepID=A0A259TZ15_9BACT|nr:MmcQ/YjbR family DNA-binding protein [Rubricoccus marinus]OZC02926.1 MmcQ-like protein [Rubricoccus marinus]
MHLDTLRDYCLAKRGATESLPFGPDALVFKVRGKMFGLLNLERLPPGIGLKCDPERGRDLRERFRGVTTGPYLNGRHWNLVLLQDDVPDTLIRELVDHSYALVVAKLTRKERAALDAAPEA